MTSIETWPRPGVDGNLALLPLDCSHSAARCNSTYPAFLLYLFSLSLFFGAYSPVLGLSNDLGSAYAAAPGYINARRWTPFLVVLYVMPQDSRE